MTAFMKFTYMNAVVDRSTRTAQTLAVALKAFLLAVELENRNAMCSVIIRGYNLRICRKHGRKAFDGKNLYTDLDFFIELTTIVREFGGKRWYPKYIGFQYSTPVSWAHLLYFPRSVFLFNQAKSWIELPRGFLKLPRQSTDAAGGYAMASIRLQRPSISDAADLIQALKRRLRERAVDGYPDINAAAKIMGMSVRTLQRALAQAGVTYSKVIEYTRFEAAAEMLTDPTPKIIDIAFPLGYEDPSHFSRAFRRIAGQSPREFRLSRLAKIGVL
jgi:AraC-like DNA-binding protein